MSSGLQPCQGMTLRPSCIRPASPGQPHRPGRLINLWMPIPHSKSRLRWGGIAVQVQRVAFLVCIVASPRRERRDVAYLHSRTGAPEALGS